MVTLALTVDVDGVKVISTNPLLQEAQAAVVMLDKEHKQVVAEQSPIAIGAPPI